VHVPDDRRSSPENIVQQARLDPVADRHLLSLPAAFRKLDAIAGLTAGVFTGTPLRSSAADLQRAVGLLTADG
jgi:hypothetical protein